jgi:hypothetical protein
VVGGATPGGWIATATPVGSPVGSSVGVGGQRSDPVNPPVESGGGTGRSVEEWVDGWKWMDGWKNRCEGEECCSLCYSVCWAGCVTACCGVITLTVKAVRNVTVFKRACHQRIVLMARVLGFLIILSLFWFFLFSCPLSVLEALGLEDLLIGGALRLAGWQPLCLPLSVQLYNCTIVQLYKYNHYNCTIVQLYKYNCTSTTMRRLLPRLSCML